MRCMSTGIGKAAKGAEVLGVITRVQGRLRSHVSFWHRTLQASEKVVDIIMQGYRLPFMAEPPSIFQFNRRTARDSVQFVEQSIIELL